MKGQRTVRQGGLLFVYMGMNFYNNLRKTLYFLKRNGLKQTTAAVRERLFKNRQSYDYCPPLKEELEQQRREVCGNPKDCPLISIVVPLYETKESFLQELMDSVAEQTYPCYELILGDFSENPGLDKLVEAYGESRFQYHYFGNNQGISENTNCVLTLAKGEYIGLLDHDDVLTPDALYEMYKKIKEEKNRGAVPRMLFSDEDKWTGKKGEYYSLHEKEEYNRELLFSCNYICHFLVMEAALLRQLGFRKEYAGAQDYDLVLRAVAAIENGNGTICHIPRVLYHWRCHEGSSAENPVSKTYAYEAGRMALKDYFAQRGVDVTVSHRQYVGLYQVEYKKPYFEARPEVGILGYAIVEKGALASGRLSQDGEVYYQGIKEGYTGYFHRAVLPQDCYATDVRRMKLNPVCRELFQDAVGEPYREDEEGFCSNFKELSSEQAAAISLKLCSRIKKAGYHIIWQW